MPPCCGRRAVRSISAAAGTMARKLKEFQIHKVTLDYTSLPQPRRELQSNEAAYGRAVDLRSSPFVASSRWPGCAVGPNYRPPQPVTPDEWHCAADRRPCDPPATRPRSRTGGRRSTTRSSNQLIEQALARNKTAQQAYARVVEARARRGIAAAGFWPTLDASAGGSRTELRGARQRSAMSACRAARDEIYNAGLDSGWELDLFGGKRRAFEAANAQLGASEADLRDVLVTLLGDVALSYVDVRTAQSRLTFAEKNLEAQRGVLDITQLARRRRPRDRARCRAGAEQLPADARSHPVAAIEPRASDEPARRADRRSARIARSDAGGAQADSGRAAGDRRRRAGRRLASPSRHSQRRAPPRRADRAKSASRPPRSIRACR